MKLMGRFGIFCLLTFVKFVLLEQNFYPVVLYGMIINKIWARFEIKIVAISTPRSMIHNEQH